MVVWDHSPGFTTGAATASRAVRDPRGASNTQETNALVGLFSKKFVRAKRHENQEPGGNLERLAATRWSADRKLRGTSGLDTLWHRGRLNQ
jgi:hypothetical protein